MSDQIHLLVRAMRPHQWAKNLLVFAGILFSRHLLDPGPLLVAVAAFGAFCAVSSTVYVLNDLLDLEQDRLHPEKRHRPLASGKLRVGVAVAGILVLLPSAIWASFRLDAAFGWIVSLYFGQNLLYTKFLKHVVILDVMLIALGFVLRAVSGALVVGVEVSSWLILCTFLLAMFLGFSKRRQEILKLKGQGEGHRRVLADYSPEFLDSMISIVTAATLMSYVLYTMSEQTILKFGTTHLILTTPFVVYGIFRYLYLMHQQGEGDNPTRILMSDPGIRADALLWVLSVIGIIYFGL